MFRVFNTELLGKSEVETVQKLVRGVYHMIEMERKLEQEDKASKAEVLDALDEAPTVTELWIDPETGQIRFPKREFDIDDDEDYGGEEEDDYGMLAESKGGR